MSDAADMIVEYRQWVLSHTIADAAVQEQDGNIKIESDFATAEVNFYELEATVVELRITSKKDDETVFFLHFELRDPEYAKSLFGEMLETFEELRYKKKIQVLLSCTSALTTGLVAEKLNEAASFSGVDFYFDAVPFPELYDRARDYDMILLAPQIAYEEARIRKVLEDIPVVNIPPRMFATYDAAAILDMVRRDFENRQRVEKKKYDKKTVALENANGRVLTLAMVLHSKTKIHIICRYYRNGEAISEETVMRRYRNLLQDIQDILDTAKYAGDDFDVIGITIPGEVRDGHLYISWMSPEVDIKMELEKRYHVPVIMKNNTHTGILGFHARHSHYKNCALLSQSIGARFGGAGVIANGRLLEGHHNIAGEIKYIMRRFYGLNIRETHAISPEEMLLTVELFARCVIAVADPEIILVRNAMIADIKDLREELLKTVPERNMPRLRKISEHDALEYMELGIMILCVEELNKHEA